MPDGSWCSSVPVPQLKPERRTEPLSGSTSQTRCMGRRFLALAFGILVAAGCATPSGESRAPATSSTAVDAAAEADSGFVPSTYVQGGSVVMPITFPDGTTAELVYPPELDLSGMRVQPYSSGYGPGFARDFLVFDKPVDDVIGGYEQAELLADYDDGDGGTVGFWRLPPDGLYLAFQFGSWTVLVYDYADEGAEMSDEDRALWATNFHGRNAEDGFLRLEAEAPLRLAAAGEHAGPELSLWFRSGDFNPQISFFPGECAPYREGKGFDSIEVVHGLAVSRESDDFAAWCVPHASMTVHVSQEPGGTFIDDVLKGLEIRNVDLASSS